MVVAHVRRSAWPILVLICFLAVSLSACGQVSTPTATPPPPTATATPLPPTATLIPTRSIAPATVTRASIATPGTPTAPNPTAVTAAYSTLQKQPSYHLEIVVTGLGDLLPVGLSNKLTYTIDANGADQKMVIDDGSGTRQEGYKVGGKTYLVTNGQATEVTSLPLLFTLPDLLYSSLTAQGVMTFTVAGNEQHNDRNTTRYNGRGSLASLAANPLFALALPNAKGEVNGPLWVETQGQFLVGADLAITFTAPQAGNARLQLEVTRVGQVGPIQLPR